MASSTLPEAIGVDPEDENAQGCDLLDEALEVADEDPDRALVLLEQAGQHLARARTLDPEDRDPLCHLIYVEAERRRLHLDAGRLDEARGAAERLLAFAREDEARFGRSYNLACALSIGGRHDEALDLLERMHETGALESSADQLREDRDLAGLAGHPRFLALLAARA